MLINTGVIAEAVAAEWGAQTAIMQLGVMETDRTLNGAGKGDKITLTSFNPLKEGLQTLEKGDLISFDQLSQTSKEVSVQHFGRGIKIFDEDIQYKLSGGKLEATAAAQLSTIFARGLDRAAFEVLEKDTNIDVVDATAGLTANLILENILKHYGEAGLEAVQAIVIPSAVAPQLLNDPQNLLNFVKASSTGYNATYRFEIGKLFNKIPVIMSDRVRAEEVEGEMIYKSIIVPKGALKYILSKEINVEGDRNIAEKASYIAADTFYGMSLMEDTIVLDTKVQ